MPDISKLSGTLIDSVGKVDGVLKDSIDSISGVTVPQGSFLLDDYSGAAAAYSVRKLSSSYSGSCIEAYRVSDGATQDIGFDGDGDLDTAAIATFASGGEVRVRTWYDQSGQSNDAVQNTSGNQPTIYDGSSVITEGGKPAVKFTYTSGEYKLVMGSAVSAVTMSIVVKVDANSVESNSYLWSDTIVSEGSGFHGGGSSASRVGYGVQLVTPTSGGFQGLVEDTDRHLMTYHDGATESTLFQDGSSYASHFLSGTPLVQRLGSRGSSQYALDGKIQELVLWNTSTQQSNRTGIETNINDYYSIY